MKIHQHKLFRMKMSIDENLHLQNNQDSELVFSLRPKLTNLNPFTVVTRDWDLLTLRSLEGVFVGVVRNLFLAGVDGLLP